MEELVLKPEELYYLAKTCKGDHLNYDYIAMVPDLQQRTAMIKEECEESLSEKGVVRENWGDISVEQEAEAFLTPIWNSSFESSISLVNLEGTQTAQTVYCHVLKGKALWVCLQQDGLHVKRLTEEILVGLVHSFMPVGYEKRTIPEQRMLKEKPIKMIVLNSIASSGEYARVEELYIVEEWICQKDQECYQIISFEDYLGIALSVLKGD